MKQGEPKPPITSWGDAVQLLADAVETGRLRFDDLDRLGKAVLDELSTRLKDRRQTYTAKAKEQGLLTVAAWRDLHDLTVQEWETARRLDLVPVVEAPAREAGGFLYLVPHDAKLSEEDLQRVRKQTYLPTRDAATFLGVSPSKLRGLRKQKLIAPHEADWTRRYPTNFYRVDELYVLRRRISASRRSASP